MAPRKRATRTTSTARRGDKAKTKLPGNFDHDAARALGKLVEQVISDPSQRKAFRENPRAAAQSAGLRRNEITPTVERIMFTLAGMSPEELRLLTELNETLIKEGLYVETGNPPMMVY